MGKTTTPAKRTYTEESRELMRDSALARGAKAAEKNHERVRETMVEVQREMAENEGIYPHNKGGLSLAEVARRAGIHPFTFHKPRYQALAEEVKLWLETLKQKTVVGRVRVRKELGVRVQEWKELYDDLLETHRVTETDLALAQSRLEEAVKENEQLRLQLADSAKLKVVSMRPKKG
jgi:hypothetical protein